MINQEDRKVLSHYSVEDLEKYIEEQSNELWVPIPLEESDIDKFINKIHCLLLDLQKDSTEDERSDTKQAIFEKCLVLLYGDDIWEWWSKLPC
jgi:hypothetical protein